MNLFKKIKNYDLGKVSYKQFYEIEAGLPCFVKNFSLYFGHDKLKKIKSLIKLKKNSLILDLGCGTGYLTKELRTKGYQCIGLDISETRIKEAGSDFLVASASKPPFKKDSFNCIIASDILEHLPGKLENHFQTLKRILKKKGEIILSVPYGFANNDRGHIHKLTIKEWELLIKKTGFSIKKILKANYSIFKLRTPITMNYIFLLGDKK